MASIENVCQTTIMYWLNKYGLKKTKSSEIKCTQCGKKVFRSKRNKKFCSFQCRANYKWRLKKEEIEKSGCISTEKWFNSKTAKQYLAETRGYKCEICTNTEWRGEPIPLILDHINGNPEDHIVINLRLVCGNCDMQLPTYKGRNAGNGRAYRRQRYAEGKSY